MIRYSLRILMGWLALLLGSCAPLATTQPEQTTYVRNSDSDKLILFVHGVLGDTNTWLNEDTRTYWPKMIADDPAFNTFDIATLRYLSPKFSRVSTIEEVAQRLLRHMRDEGILKRKELYFIAHSMGGLVVKRILVDLNRPNEQDLATLRRVRAVLYLSTPAQGAQLADMASWISLNPQFRDMAPADLNSYVQTLENQWQNLLRDRNQAKSPFPQSFCAYETQATGGIMVVNRIYAATGCDQTPYAMDLNHSGMAKPKSTRTDPYAWAKARVLEATSITLAPIPEWQRQQVSVLSADNITRVVRHDWRDIHWAGTEGWLCGSIETGGGAGQYLGRGIMLHTYNSGASWSEVAKDKFRSGKGQLVPWGQTWDEVGPITRINVYSRMISSGVVRNEGWIAALTGIYSTDDAAAGEWKRVSPDPPGLGGFAQFAAMVQIEGFRELYVVGWQGIAHWERGGAWKVQMPTYSYLISAIAAYGDTNRDVWAVGLSGVNELGQPSGSDSYGAVYRLMWPSSTWSRLPLPGISFKRQQNVRDVYQSDGDTVLAVGDFGLILKGKKQGEGWVWKSVESKVEKTLSSLAYDYRKHVWWAVGDAGLILKSADNGDTWHQSAVQDENGLPIALDSPLFRIRFFGDQGWIVGHEVVLKSR
jgi:Putative serine esterase (DUF676)/Photosynthesis system II assembly factor YCF48